jgi:putative flippase GtrA
VLPPAPASWIRTRLAQLVRYATVSAIATSTGLSILAMLVGVAGMSAGWANVIATTVGTAPSFELNRRWVWRRADRSLLRQAVPFLAIALVELVLSTLAVHAADGWARDHHLHRVARTAVVLAANVVAFGTMWVLQFVICDRILFRSRPTGAHGGPAAATATFPVVNHG